MCVWRAHAYQAMGKNEHKQRGIRNVVIKWHCVISYYKGLNHSDQNWAKQLASDGVFHIFNTRLKLLSFTFWASKAPAEKMEKWHVAKDVFPHNYKHTFQILKLQK